MAAGLTAGVGTDALRDQAKNASQTTTMERREDVKARFMKRNPDRNWITYQPKKCGKVPPFLPGTGQWGAKELSRFGRLPARGIAGAMGMEHKGHGIKCHGPEHNRRPGGRIPIIGGD